MKAMILAAGLGERMRPLTHSLPKPLLPVGNSTLIELHLQKLKAAGIEEVVINISWLAEKIASHLGNGSHYGLRIQYSYEEKPLETAGGINQALPLLGREPFLLINADTWSDYDLKQLAQHRILKQGILAHLVLVNNPEHHPDGDFLLDDDSYVAEKQNPAPPSSAAQISAQSYTFSGMSVLHPKLFEQDVASNKLADFIRMASRHRAVSAELHQGRWMDIGTPERLAALRVLLS